MPPEPWYCPECGNCAFEPGICSGCGKTLEQCDHVWVGKRIPGTPDNPEEYIEFCDLCGMENPGSYVE